MTVPKYLRSPVRGYQVGYLNTLSVDNSEIARGCSRSSTGSLLFGTGGCESIALPLDALEKTSSVLGRIFNDLAMFSTHLKCRCPPVPCPEDPCSCGTRNSKKTEESGTRVD